MEGGNGKEFRVLGRLIETEQYQKLRLLGELHGEIQKFVPLDYRCDVSW